MFSTSDVQVVQRQADRQRQKQTEAVTESNVNTRLTR